MNLKKQYDKTLKNILTVSEDLLQIELEVYKNRADHLNNNLRVIEISILTFFQFYFKINRYRLEVVVKATYDLHPNKHWLK